MIKESSDVMTFFSNLANDQVLTPIKVVNGMLNTLPKDLWSNKNATFLNPSSKSGLFLREIAKRLNEGLINEIPDQKERYIHILKNQIFGIGTLEMYGLMTRRTVYCSKTANGKYSVTKDCFDDEQGNIYFKKISRKYINNKCTITGINKDTIRNLKNNHAYNFIHENPKEIFNMNFDVIIGNPPYQLDDKGAGASATMIYPKFVQQAIKLQPRYLTMIIPSRWFVGGKGLNEFRKTMLEDRRIREIHDFDNAKDCFPNDVSIKGGVCYFLWDRDNEGLCKIVTREDDKIISTSERHLLEKGLDVFIRDDIGLEVVRKVLDKKEIPFSTVVSARKPFGLPTTFKDFKQKPFDNSLKIYANKKIGYIKKDQIIRGQDVVDAFKLFVPKAIGSGQTSRDVVKPILGEPNSCSTETYIMIGPFESKKIASNVMSYIKTKFFHFVLGQKKITQDATAKVYDFIPMQDFNEVWTDEKLFKKYNLSKSEIDYINNNTPNFG
tara:strand:+ start:910 stop:2394 length:1485 start_codon:yes stop_codon:yes gene_type:complete